MDKDNMPNIFDDKEVGSWTGNNNPSSNKKKSITEKLKSKTILWILLAIIIVLAYSLYRNAKDINKTPVQKVDDTEYFNQLPEPTAENFMDCYNAFDAIVTKTKYYDKYTAKLYANKLAMVQYNMLAAQIDALPMPNEKNVDDVRRKIYDIGWLNISDYDDNVVYYSKAPMTKKYFQKKLSYVRLIVGTYAAMGYTDDRITKIMGDTPGNYYGIRN